MKLSNKLFLLLSFFALLSLPACNDDDIDDNPDEEVITTLNYSLFSTSAPSVTLSFRDLDGDGGTAPTISGGTLMANTTYTGTVEFLNESVTPTEVVTEEIEEEDDEHQLFFVPSTSLNATVEYTDTDDDGNPVGLSTTLMTGEASDGQLTIILRHQPNKSADGVAGGDIENAGGETDIEVTFDVTIQ